MLNPLLLWFLPLAMIPVILKLITLYRLRTIELSTFRFLMDSYFQQRRRLKLLEYLLLILRTLVVVVIIMLLSRPVLNRLNMLGRSGRDVTVLIDSGASMSLTTGGSTSLSRAQAAARTIVGMMKPDDKVTLVRVEEKPYVLASRFANQTQPLLDEIDRIKTGASGSNMALALEEVFTSNARADKIVYIISDANKRGWSSLMGHPLLTKVGPEQQVVVMNVGPTEPISNVGLVGDPPRPLQTIAGLPVLLSFTVVNGATDKPIDTTVSVFLDDEQVQQVPLTIPPNQKVTRKLSVTPAKSGFVRGRFQLPPDGFPDDDVFYFALNVEPRLNVVLVTPIPASTPGLFGFGATDAPELFVKTALTAPLSDTTIGVGKPAVPGAAAAPAGLTETQKIAASLQITTLSYNALSDPVLASADVIVLCNAPMDPALALRLRKFVIEGGGLMVLPGSNVMPEIYNATLFNPPLPAVRRPGMIEGLQPLGVRLLTPVGNPDDESKFLPLTGIDLTHSVLSAFAEQGIEFFTTARVYRYFPLQLATAQAKPLNPAPAAKGAAPVALPTPQGPPVDPEALVAAQRVQVMMRLPDRSPTLVEASLGDGKIMLAGFPATPDWSNVPLKPEFVPLMLRSVAHLRRAASVTAPSSIQPHEPAPIRITDRWPTAQVQALDPADRPSTIRLARSGRDMVGALLETDRRGYYRFMVWPRAVSAPDRVERGFAVNLGVTQADFAMLTQEQLDDTLNPMKFTYLRTTFDDPTLSRQLTERREIWRHLIWIVFGFIALEFLLSTLKPSKDRASAMPGSLVAGKAAAGPTGVRAWAGRLTETLTGAGRE